MIATAIMTALLTLGPSPTANSTAQRPATPISLEEALRLGDLHSPLVRRAHAETDGRGTRRRREPDPPEQSRGGVVGQAREPGRGQ